MDTGVYLNLFQVDFADQVVTLMKSDRSAFAQLRDLRRHISERGIRASVYAVHEDVFGYGPEQQGLSQMGFRPTTLRLSETPQLTSRLILEGFVEALSDAGYSYVWEFGRAIAFQLGKPLLELPAGVRLFRGVQVAPVYFHDPETERLTFALALDAVFGYRDTAGTTLSPREIVARFGAESLRRLRTRQGDFAPGGGINIEVSRQRLTDFIMPFVQARHTFSLACGIPAELMQAPTRVILVEEEEQ
jgi:hypothetical protein